jgi:hypothetical protein
MLVVFAGTRWPGLMWPNFSAAYALAFCAGLYFPPRMAWFLPLGTLAVTDLLLNLFYGYWPQWYQLSNYLGYACLIGLGCWMRQKDHWTKLVGGGVVGAFLFYLLTNTIAWFLNPFDNEGYTRDITGWLLALTQGTDGFPPTWMFLRNTLLSGGLFTGLFVAAAKWAEAAEETEEEIEEKTSEPVTDVEDAEPEEITV